jgi:hypothetical protein
LAVEKNNQTFRSVALHNAGRLKVVQDPTQPQNRTYRKDAVAGQKKLNLQSGCREMAASERWQHQVSNRNENPGVMVEEEGKRKAAGDSERDRCRAVPEVNP